VLRFIRLVAIFGMVLACLCYVWDVIDHWGVIRAMWRGRSFSGYQEDLHALLNQTLTRNTVFCMAGIAYCFAGRMAAREKARKLAAAAKKRQGPRPRIDRDGYLARLTQPEQWPSGASNGSPRYP
jgi:hypothetical protein